MLAGIINCIKYAQKLFPDDEITGVVRGMHLEGVPDIRLQFNQTHENFLKVSRKFLLVL